MSRRPPLYAEVSYKRTLQGEQYLRPDQSFSRLTDTQSTLSHRQTVLLPNCRAPPIFPYNSALSAFCPCANTVVAFRVATHYISVHHLEGGATAKPQNPCPIDRQTDIQLRFIVSIRFRPCFNLNRRINSPPHRLLARCPLYPSRHLCRKCARRPRTKASARSTSPGDL